MVNLEGKVAIVTGAGQGRGAATARLLGRCGVWVAVNDINPDRADKIAAEINKAGGRAIAVTADVANKFQCVHIVETTRAEWGRLDILINHAQVSPRATILKTDEWDWQRTIDVNLKGTFFMCQLAGRVMADENQARGGQIVNLIDPAGYLRPATDRASLAASQAGVVGFTRECAREFHSFGVRVNAILEIENPTAYQPWVTPVSQSQVKTLSEPIDPVLVEHPPSALLAAALCWGAADFSSGDILAVDVKAIMG